MDPFTFGMVAVGTAGGSLFLVSVLKQYGINVNEDAIKIALEMTKLGGILYLLEHMAKIFL